VSALSAPHFHNEEAAYEYVEARIWPEGPVCPHCGGVERIGKMGGQSTRIGTYKCYQCRKPFTVKVGTIFEASHVPMRLWLQAIYLIASSKKGFSSNQLHRTLGVTLKTAWFMSHRIREAMRSGDLSPFGAEGGVVEADETYIGREPNTPVTKGGSHKMKVVSLIDRGTGRARSFVVDNVNVKTIGQIVAGNMVREARLVTDEGSWYRRAL
jgi:transposase-like protein